MNTAHDLDLLAIRIAQASAAITAAVYAFQVSARAHALQSGDAAWCGGDTAPGAIVLLGHCLSCWTDAAAAGLAVLLALEALGRTVHKLTGARA